MRINTASTIKSSSLLGETPAARQKIKLRKKDKKTLKKLWEKTQNTAKKYYDTRRKNIFFIIEDKILFNAKNLRVRKPYKKLTNRYIRPFKIIKAVGLNTYQLKLPEQYGRLHKTFHISLLKPYIRRAGEKPPRLVSLNENNRYQVESIRKERVLKDKIQFLIK